MINKSEFFTRIKHMPETILSKTGIASYTQFELNGDVLSFTRVNPQTSWNLSIEALYNIYSNNNFINTSVIKSITKGRVNSPSVAVLMAINCIDVKGNRKN